MPIRITGLNSGLDTESIISALVSAYSYKTDKYKKAQTKLSWKQDAWKSLNTKIYSFYTNAGNLRLSTNYNLKSTTVSDSTKATVSATSSSVNGSYALQVTSLAKAGYLTGAELSDDITASSTLLDLGYSGSGKISLTTGGTTKDISVSEDMTLTEFTNQLKDAGVNASYDENNHRIYISAKSTGKENDFSLTGADTGGTAALSALGIYVNSAANIEEYTELAQYAGMSAAEIEAIRDNKVALKTENAELTAENAYYQNAIAYAKASEAINAVGKGKNVADFTLLKTLASQSSLENAYVDNDGNYYTYNSENAEYSTVKELTGGTYDQSTGKYTLSGIEYEGTYIGDKFYVNITTDNTTGLTAASDKYTDLKSEFGLVTTSTDDDGNTVEDSSALATFISNLATVKSVAEAAELNGAEQQALIEQANQAIADGTVDTFTEASENAIKANKLTIKNNEDIIEENPKITTEMTSDDITAFLEKAAYAAEALANTSYSAGATRVNGEDATIYVNGAKYTGTSNTFSINGLSITAAGVTGDSYDSTESNAVNITVNTDAQGIYDKVKDFITQYNALINEITSLYNAEPAKGYEPLTDEEKDAMSDTEVEKWEEKIKSALLRRDGTLDSVMNAMITSMSKGVEVDGKTYYLSSFGIKTLGYLNAAENQQNAFHIDGDEDDAASSGNTDKLMAAISNDPDSVIAVMQQMASNLYDAIGDKMKRTTLSSVYTVYNDKEMASEYSDYTDTISKWEEKLKEQEDYYYNKFTQMETALSKLNSQTSSLSSLFGN